MAAGMTQRDVGRALKRYQSFVSHYEIGDRRLDMIELIEICDVFGTDPHAVLSEIIKVTSTRPPTRGSYSSSSAGRAGSPGPSG